jgi:hypothetical protein
MGLRGGGFGSLPARPSVSAEGRRAGAAGADYLDLYAARAIVRTFGPEAPRHAAMMAERYAREELLGDAHRWRRIAVAIREVAKTARLQHGS